MKRDHSLLLLLGAIVLTVIIPSVDASKIIISGGDGFCLFLVYAGDTILCDGKNSTATFTGGTNISLTAFPANDTIRIDAAGGSGGESNTASNVGLGDGWFKQKTGVDLEFLSILGENGIIITNNTDNLTLGLSNVSKSSISSSGTWTESDIPTGSMILISANETDQSVTVSNSDAIVRSYSLAANTYSRIIVESEVEVSFEPLSNSQDILIKIKNDGTTKETFTTHSLARVGTSGVPIKTSFVQTGPSTITITQSGTSSDSNTDVLVHSIRIYGVT